MRQCWTKSLRTLFLLQKIAQNLLILFQIFQNFLMNDCVLTLLEMSSLISNTQNFKSFIYLNRIIFLNNLILLQQFITAYNISNISLKKTHCISKNEWDISKFKCSSLSRHTYKVKYIFFIHSISHKLYTFLFSKRKKYTTNTILRKQYSTKKQAE